MVKTSRIPLTGWLGLDLAELFGVRSSTVTAWVKNGCPRGADGRFDPRQVLQWRLARLREDSHAMTAGGDTPAMERFRLARAKLSELDLLERQRVLLRRAPVFSALERGAGILRRCFEGFARRHPELYGEVEEAVSAWSDEWGGALQGVEGAEV